MDNIYPNRYSAAVDAGALIKRARQRAGLTQVQLAEAAGTSQPTLAAYESGAKSPSVRTLDRIIRSTGATLHVTLRDAPRAQGALLAGLRDHSEAIRSAALRRRIRNVRVFGSVARGEETKHSDVDLLVDFDAVRYGVLPLAAFAQDVERMVGRHVDVTTAVLLRPEVCRQALAEAVPL